MKTSQDWLKEIEELYENQKSGQTAPPQAREMNQTIGKVISLTKLQLEYNKRCKRNEDGPPAIPMLEAGKDAPPTS